MNEYHGLNSYISGKINSQNQKTVWKLANCRDIRDLLLESQLRSVCSLDWNSANQAHDSAPFSLSNSNRRFSGLKINHKANKGLVVEHLQSWIWTLIELANRTTLKSSWAGLTAFGLQLSLGGACLPGLQLSLGGAYSFLPPGLQLSLGGAYSFLPLTTFIGRGLQHRALGRLAASSLQL